MNHLELKARQFAENAHKGATRKTSGEPYIKHPIQVASILKKANMPLPVIMAGYLHDTVEDTPVTIEQIKEEFGEEVREYVAFNTEDKDGTWEERKTHTVEQLKNATLYKKALVVADKYANLLELIQNHKKLGDKIWESFKRGKEKQYWYFLNVAKSGMLNIDDKDIPTFFKEYEATVESFFKSLDLKPSEE